MALALNRPARVDGVCHQLANLDPLVLTREQVERYRLATAFVIALVAAGFLPSLFRFPEEV